MKPAGGILHHKKFMSMTGGIPLIKMANLRSTFQYEENNSIVAETMEEYALASA